MFNIFFYMPSFGNGGVERMLVNLANALNKQAVHVTFLTTKQNLPFVDQLDHEISHLKLFPESILQSKAKNLAKLIDAHNCDVVLCAKDKACLTALKARALSTRNIIILSRPGTTYSARDQRRNIFKRIISRIRIQKIFSRADLVVSNSDGVRNDILMLTNSDPSKNYVVRNPVITPKIYQQSNDPIQDDIFKSISKKPFIIGVGGLRHQKGFDVLIRAHAIVKRDYDIKLVILGSGHLESTLRGLSDDLGTHGDVHLLGFVPNPYPWIKQAQVFVLSSRWEGSPNVLTEALALGTPVVATNCPSGPKEILKDGLVAPLVKVDDHDALAEAIIQQMLVPQKKSALQNAASEYKSDKCASEYINIITKHLHV